LQAQDPEKVQRVMAAMLQMNNIDIGRLKQAAAPELLVKG
jgi:hypothetical protein